MEIKQKYKWDLGKLKSFCTMKETISPVEKQPSEWKTITANETTDKELSSKIYKQFMQLNTRKMNNPIKKWAKELNRHFSKEDIQRANKTQKKICSFLISQHHSLLEKCKLKTQWSIVSASQNGHHKKVDKQQYLERVWRKRKHSYTVDGNANWYSHYGEQCGNSLKTWE